MSTELTDLPLLPIFLVSAARRDAMLNEVNAGGLESRRSRLPVYVVGFLVASVILLIQDLDRLSSGFIRVSQQPLIDATASMAGFAD